MIGYLAPDCRHKACSEYCSQRPKQSIENSMYLRIVGFLLRRIGVGRAKSMNAPNR
jgi:hypothetical protein